MSQQSSNRPSPEQLQELRKAALKGPFSLEELTELSRLFQEPSFRLWQAYLLKAEDHLNEQIWKCETWDKYLFLKGQKHDLERLKRAPEEIKQMRESALETLQEKTNGNY